MDVVSIVTVQSSLEFKEVEASEALLVAEVDTVADTHTDSFRLSGGEECQAKNGDNYCKSSFHEFMNI